MTFAELNLAAICIWDNQFSDSRVASGKAR